MAAETEGPGRGGMGDCFLVMVPGGSFSVIDPAGLYLDPLDALAKRIARQMVV